MILLCCLWVKSDANFFFFLLLMIPSSWHHHKCKTRVYREDPDDWICSPMQSLGPIAMDTDFKPFQFSWKEPVSRPTGSIERTNSIATGAAIGRSLRVSFSNADCRQMDKKTLTERRLQDILTGRSAAFPSNGLNMSQKLKNGSSEPQRNSLSSQSLNKKKLKNGQQGTKMSGENMRRNNRERRRYECPKCPYATDRRDLFTRHENIHRDEKPFRCYVCNKMFNRADHVKKHFLRIHKGLDYDVKLTRRIKGIDYDDPKDGPENRPVTKKIEGHKITTEDKPLRPLALALNPNQNAFPTNVSLPQVLEPRISSSTNALTMCTQALSLGIPTSSSAVTFVTPVITPVFSLTSSSPLNGLCLSTENLLWRNSKLHETLSRCRMNNGNLDLNENIQESEISSVGSVSPKFLEDEDMKSDEGSFKDPEETGSILSILSLSELSSSSKSEISSEYESDYQREIWSKYSPKEAKRQQLLSSVADGRKKSKLKQFNGHHRHGRMALKIDSPLETFDCQTCGCSFRDFKSLHTHRYLLHRHIPERQSSQEQCLPCPLCNFKGYTEKSMLKHMMRHVVNYVMLKVGRKSKCNRNKFASDRKSLDRMNSSFIPDKRIDDRRSSNDSCNSHQNRRKQPLPKKIVKSVEDNARSSPSPMSSSACSS